MLCAGRERDGEKGGYHVHEHLLRYGAVWSRSRVKRKTTASYSPRRSLRIELRGGTRWAAQDRQEQGWPRRSRLSERDGWRRITWRGSGPPVRRWWRSPTRTPPRHGTRRRST